MAILPAESGGDSGGDSGANSGADAGAAATPPSKATAEVAATAQLGPSPLASGDELPVAAAWAAIRAKLAPIEDTEIIPVAQAAGRVLAQPLDSPINVPAHDNSAMDGYALRGACLAPDGPTRLQAQSGTVFAGQPP